MLSTIILITSWDSNAYAVQTPSNMSYDPHDVEIDYNGYLEELSDEEVEIFDAEFIDNTVTSDRDIAEYVKDLFIMAIQEVMPMEEKEEAVLITSVDSDESPKLLSTGSRSSNQSVYKNTVVYTGKFGGNDARLVIPYEDYSSLNVIGGKLINVGHNTVTGRILYSNSDLNTTDYETYSYILNPIYGSTNNVYSYGSFNYQRHYYLNTTSGYNRISYNDTYGDFMVTDTDIYYSASERQLYVLYILLLFLGVNWLWTRRH